MRSILLVCCLLPAVSQGQGRPSAGLINGPGQIASVATDSQGRAVFLAPLGSLVFQNALGKTVHQQSFTITPQADLIQPTVMRVRQSTGPARGVVAGGSQQVLDFAGNNGITPQSILSSVYIADSTGRLTWAGGLRSDSTMSLADVYRAPGGEVYAAGKYFDIDRAFFNSERTTYGHYFLTRLAPDGTVLWARRLADADTNFGYAGLVSLQPLGRHGVRVFSGFRDRRGGFPGGPGYNLHVADVDSGGQATRIRSSSSLAYNVGFNRIYTGKSHYYFYTYGYSQSGQGGNIVVQKVDTALSDTLLPLAHTVTLSATFTVTTDYSLAEQADGGLLVTGTGLENANTTFFFYATRIRADGTPWYWKRYDVCAGFDANNNQTAALPGGGTMAVYQPAGGGSAMLVLDTTGQVCRPDTTVSSAIGYAPMGFFWRANNGLRVTPKQITATTYAYTQQALDSTAPQWMRVQSICRLVQAALFPPDTLRICANSYVLRPRTGAGSFLWSDGSSADSLLITHSGRYSVVYTNGCFGSATDTVEVLLARKPSLSIASPQTICPGDTLRLTGGVAEPGVPYRWLPTDHLTHINGPSATVTAPSKPTDSVATHTVVYTLQALASGGCDTSLQVSVRFAPPALGRLSALALVPYDTLIALEGSNSHVESWLPIDGALYNSNPVRDTAYMLWRGWLTTQLLMARIRNQEGCMAIRTYLRPAPPDTVAPPASLPDEVIFNLITANGDSSNPSFQIKYARSTETYALNILSRWGQNVFEGAYKAGAWPAADTPAGIYYYYVTGRGRAWRGWVELLR